MYGFSPWMEWNLAELASTSPDSNQAQFTRGGGVEVGHTVAPGVYVVHITVPADARNEVMQKLVHVV